MTATDTGRNSAAATDSVDQDLLDACTAFLAADASRRNRPHDPAGDDGPDGLDRYYDALERVTATVARTSAGRRMKATVALRAMQSVAGDLQPEERCGLAALADILGSDPPANALPAETGASTLAKLQSQLDMLGAVVGILNNLTASSNNVTPSQWVLLGTKLDECHVNLTTLVKVAFELDATQRTTEPNLPAPTGTGPITAWTARPAPAARPGIENARFLRRLLRNAARAAIEACDEAELAHTVARPAP